MNNEEYNNIKERITNLLDFYKEKKINDTKYNLKLSNGETINIKYKQMNLAHLLGINTNYLRSTGLYKGYSFQILYEIVENIDALQEQIEQGHIDPSKVFSDYLEEKLKNFKRICNLNLFDIEFIVEYKQSRNLSQIEPLYDGYYVGFTNGYSLSVVGFKKDDNSNIYYPNTSRLMKANTKESEEFLKRLIENQMITTIEIMYKKTIDNNKETTSTPYYYHHQEKLNKIAACKEYAETYNGIANTITSNLYYIDKVININIDNRTNSRMYEEIAETIIKKKMIDVLDLKNRYEYIDESILNIVSSYNDSLMSNTSNDSTYSYKAIITELENLKLELEKRKTLLEKVEDENNKLKAQIELLKLENQYLNQNQEEAIKVLTRNKK